MRHPLPGSFTDVRHSRMTRRVNTRHSRMTRRVNTVNKAILCLGIISGLIFFNPANADPVLDRMGSIEKTLTNIRSTISKDRGRDVNSDLVQVKLDLHAWVGENLPRSNENLDAAEKRINSILERRGLTLENYLEDSRGYIGGISFLNINENKDYLLVTISIRTECGYADSSYVYKKNQTGWHPFLQLYQDRDEDAFDNSVLLSHVEILPIQKEMDKTYPLVVMVSHSWTCGSFWQNLYVRIWRVSPINHNPFPLIETVDLHYFEPTPSIKTFPRAVTLEFSGYNLSEPGMMTPIWRNYSISPNDKVKISYPQRHTRSDME